MAAAATGGAAVEVRVADGESGPEVGIVYELDDALVELLLGILIVEHLERLGGGVHDVSLGLLLLEGHSELGSGACETGHVDLDTVSVLLVLLEQIGDELLCIRCDRYHGYRFPLSKVENL